MADVQFDSFGDSLGTNYTHTCTGANRILFFATRGSTANPSANGVSPTLLNEITPTDALAPLGVLRFWVLLNPALGANAITFGGGSTTCISVSYKHDTKAIALFEQVVNISPTLSPPSLTTTIVSSVNKCLAVVMEASYAFGAPPTAGAGLVYRGGYTTSVNVPTFFDSNVVISPAGSFSGTTNQGGGGAKIYHIMQLIGISQNNPKRDVPPIGQPVILSGNTIYGTPARAINIIYTTSGAGILEGSMDNGDTFVTIDTAPGAGLRSVSGVVAPWIRPSTDVTAIFKKSKTKL
jgi:hypothetical protein